MSIDGRACAAVVVASLLLGAAQDPLPPEPEESAQKEPHRLIRDLFKTEYARTDPADRSALARKLLEKGQETVGDLPTRYVLLREARDVAAQAGDVGIVLEACDALAGSFQVDRAAMKLAALNKAVPLVKGPESLRAAARGYLGVVQDSIQGDDYESATTALGKAETLAKGAQDPGLLSRIQDLRKDVGTLKSEFQKVKTFLYLPDAPDLEAAGRYLCFVKGDWNTGLRALLKAGKPPLSGQAEKDLSDFKEVDKQLDVAEGWWSLAQAEKSAWKKSRILARAQYWYEVALPSTSGLGQVRAQKRLAEIEDGQQGGVGLLKFVDLKKDAVVGEFRMDGSALVIPSGGNFPRLQLPYTPPPEYDLTLVVERKEGASSLNLGLVIGGSQCMVVLDGDKEGNVSGIEMIDGQNFAMNETTVKGKWLEPNKPALLCCSVRKGGLVVTVNQRKLLEWKGDSKRLSVWTSWQIPAKNVPFIGSAGSSFRITKLALTPISGTGKPLRP